MSLRSKFKHSKVFILRFLNTDKLLKKNSAASRIFNLLVCIEKSEEEHLRLFSSDAFFYVGLPTYAQYASMNEFTCSEHSVRIHRSKKRSTGNQHLLVFELLHSYSKYGLETQLKSLFHLFVRLYTDFARCTVTEPIVF